MDNAATSFPKPAAVLTAMTDYATQLGASAGRGAYAEAVETGKLIATCRSRLNALFNGEDPNHFIFTLNCSDALNLAIKGLMRADDVRAHAICTRIDHNSILRPVNALADAGQLDPTRIPVDPKTALVDPDHIRRAILQIRLLDGLLQTPHHSHPRHQITQERERSAVFAAEEFRRLGRAGTHVGAQFAQPHSQMIGGVLLRDAPQVVAYAIEHQGKQQAHHQEEAERTHFSFTS